MSTSPVISILICTYNNAESLKITLQQLSHQHVLHKDNVEIILVDNNSPDQTKKICTEFFERNAILGRYVFEGRQGLSHARNSGIAQARGNYILFTDDDADIPSNWTESYLKRIEESSPDCLYSRISIIWDKEKPWWFIPEYTPCFVGVDYGDLSIVVDDIHKEFYGKNFCMKKSVLLTLGGFDPALGRNGTKLIAGEETLLYRKMIEQKKYLLYFPEAPVGHRLKDREYLAENIKKQFIDGAYSMHHIAKIMARKKILGRPLRAAIDNCITLFRSSLLYSRYKISGEKAVSYYHYLNILKSITFIKLWLLSK